MIRLGIRLALGGGRGAAIGIALTSLAVAIGAAILLFALSFGPALQERAQRSAWRTSFVLAQSPTSPDAALLMVTVKDAYAGEVLQRVLLAPLVPDAPAPPGIPRLPRPGEAFVSPALAALLAVVPADQLGARIGTVVGTIGDEALRSPQELVAIVGSDAATLGELGPAPIRRFGTVLPDREIPAIAMLMIVLAVVGALAPVAVFVSTATRLSAARREQRLAALRLVGATPLQVTRLAVVEALLATIMGLGGGVVLFFLTRPLVAMVPLDEATWFPASIVPPLDQAVGLLLAIPVVGTAAAVVALRRVVVTPLGVRRRETPPMPSVARAIPLIGSLVVLVGAMALMRGSAASSTPSLVLLGGAFGGVVLGIVLVGPWLTVLVGRVLDHVPGGAATLLASRRLTDDPRGSFGAIAGVIMAVFVASAFFTFAAYAGQQVYDSAGIMQPNQVFAAMPPNDGPAYAEVATRIGATQGVTDVLAVGTAEVAIDGSQLIAWVVPCARIARQFDLPSGTCGSALVHRRDASLELPAGAYQLSPDRGDRRPIPFTIRAGSVDTLGPVNAPAGLPDIIVEPAALPPGGRTPAIDSFYVTTDGTAGAMERVRTTIEHEAPTAYVRLTTESRTSNRAYEEFGRVVGLGLVGSLVLAGCSLAVAVTTSILERRRQFALLRSAGMPVSRLRALVLLQAGAPLVAVAVFSAALGIAVTQVILRLAVTQTIARLGGGPDVPLPDASLALIFVGSLASALAVVALMLPPLERLTQPDSVRIE